MNHRILAFDSGIGGLSIVQSLIPLLNEKKLKVSINFLADTEIFPYGEREDHFLIERIISLIGKAIEQFNPTIIIIACNTASTLALPHLRQIYKNVTFVGCVPPIKWAAQISKTKYIGVLATRATVQRTYLNELQKQFAADCELIAYGSPLLATIAENVFQSQIYDVKTIESEVRKLLLLPHGDKIDTICLGCTHYSLIVPHLRQYAPAYIQWLDPANAVAKHTIHLLETTSNPTTTTHINDYDIFYHTSSIKNSNLFLSKIKPLGFKSLSLFS